MKVIIAGSRDLDECEEVFEYIKSADFPIHEVVCGTAHGVDTCGMYYAMDNLIPVKYFPANWKKHGKAAGPIRNSQMAEYADAAIFVINNKSPGSMDCLRKIKAHLKPFFAYHLIDGILDYVESCPTGVAPEFISGDDPRVATLRSRIAAIKAKQL